MGVCSSVLENSLQKEFSANSLQLREKIVHEVIFGPCNYGISEKLYYKPIAYCELLVFANEIARNRRFNVQIQGRKILNLCCLFFYNKTCLIIKTLQLEIAVLVGFMCVQVII